MQSNMNYIQLFSDCWALGTSYLPCGLTTWAATFLPGFGAETINLGHRRFRVLQKLGEGGYAVVLLVTELASEHQPHPDPEPRALKKVLVQSSDHFDAVQQEMLIHSTVQHHPNILPLLDYCCSESGVPQALTPPPPPHALGGPHQHQHLSPHPQPNAAAASDPRSPDGGVGRLGGPPGGGAGSAVVGVSGSGGGGDGGCDRVACFLFPVFRDGTLAAELDRLRERGQMLPTREVLRAFVQIANAAAHVHAHGYAHRDIKPLNVLIAVDPSLRHQQAGAGGQQLQMRRWQAGVPGQPATGDPEAGEALMSGDEAGSSGPRYRCVLMDFGSARQRRVDLASRAQALQLQEDAEAHCSAPYRAPELFDAPSPASLDLAACDVWALGATLFHLMYGEPPFQRAMNAAGGSLALAVLNCAIGWPRAGSPAYPPELHQLVMAAMAQEPGQRPSAAQLAEMAAALAQRNLPEPKPAAAGA